MLPVHEISQAGVREPNIKMTRFHIHMILVSGLLFLLIWEWLRPLTSLSHWTDIYRLEPFLIACACFIFIDAVRLPEWLGWLCKIIICWAIVCYFFGHRILFFSSWWSEYLELTIMDIQRLVEGQWLAFSAENRTFLFLLGCSFIIYAVQSIVVYRRSAGWFVMVTHLYLLALYYLAGVDTTFGIVRTFAIGLLLISYLYGMSHHPFLWIFMSILVIASSVTTGLRVASNHEAMAKPITWNFSEQETWWSSLFSVSMPAWFHSTGTSGYSEDDTRLGGQILQTEDTVFTAMTPTLSYWRGESKSYYTGQGWTEPSSQTTRFDANISSFRDESGSVQEVWLQQPQSILFTGGPIIQIDTLQSDHGETMMPAQVMYNQQSGKYSMRNHRLLSYYKVHVLSNGRIPMEETPSMEPYLQLPETLPDRVRTLAKQVVEHEKDPYQQAKILEAYLKNTYEYNLQKSKIPGPDHDFVDHFLFAQKSGYCDHFSTAMVVMLRTLNIPARWVKGYSTGDVKETIEQADEGQPTTLYKVEVKQKHAHSWVEVYFPEHGWVPFEPTPSMSFGNHSVQTVYQDDPSNAPRLQTDRVQSLWREIGLAAIVSTFIVTFFLFWRKRNKRSGAKQGDAPLYVLPQRIDVLDQTFERLWHNIFARFGKIEPHQTIREYILQLECDDEQRRAALLTFANLYESVRYHHPDRSFVSREIVYQLFKKIVT